MVEPYHGYIYVKKKDTNTIPVQITSPQSTIKLETEKQGPPYHIFNPEKYKDLLIEKQPIKYLPPELIPKEKSRKIFESFKSRSGKSKSGRSKSGTRKNRVKSYDYLKEKQKGFVFDKEQDRHSLNKYRFDINMPHRQQQLQENDLKPQVEKKILMMKPQIIPFEDTEIIPIKKSKTKKRSSSLEKLSLKIKKDKPEDVINSIDKSDKLYKEKFEKLKKAYIKKHNTLLTVFDGYQHIYDEYTKKQK
jgi:hypothetical protein